MAPFTRTSSSSRTTKPLARRIKRKPKPKRTHFKKNHNHHRLPPETKNQEASKVADMSEDSPSPSPSPSSSEVTTDEASSATTTSSSSSCCSTPKGQKFRIPEIATCPPAPRKKPRSLLSNNCSLRRSPISFFAPPDLELFFFLALPDNFSV